MKKILLSLSMIAVVAIIAVGATGAFFSDTETSTGNTFAAGAIDLGVDNHSYYNGVLNDGTTWRVDYDIDPLLGDNPDTTNVVETDYVIEAGRQFFNFDDLKPGDWGEDTISLHVKNNDSYLCADVTLTSDEDNDQTEPEIDDGDLIANNGPQNDDGELADSINFYWWADDGDNVYETCQDTAGGLNGCKDETLLPAGSLGNLDVGDTATVALADSDENIWGDPNFALPGDSVRFVAKAWCFGDNEMEPYAQDGGNQQSGPDDRPIKCDGAGENNMTQTDSLTADISFRAVQSRNNADFQCQIPD